MTINLIPHEPSGLESNPLQESGFFSEDRVDLEKLFEEHVLSSQEVVAVAKAARKWKAYKKESSFRNSQLQRLVDESKDLIKLSADEYSNIKSLLLNKQLHAVDKILQSKWERVLKAGHQLEDLGYYVFLHSAAFEHSLLIEMQTYMQDNRDDIGVSSNWNLFRKFRENPEQSLKYKNSEDYFSSTLCSSINFSDSRITDRWPNSKWLLACDGVLSNQDENESAYSFYKKNYNFSDIETLFKQFFSKKFQNYWLSAVFGEKGIKKLYDLATSCKSEGLIQGQGQVFLMGVLKSTLEDPSTNYVYRSHPYGKRCACRDQTHKAFVDLLQQDQKGNSSKCLISDELELNPQYRMLIENFDKDPEKVVISLSSLTPIQEKLFKENFFWPLSYALKQLTKLAAYEGAEEELVNILNTLPRGLSYWKRRSSLEMRLFLEKELQPLYLLALDQIINDKQELLQAVLEKLPQELQGKLRVLLRRAENIETETLDLLRKNPSLVQNLPHSSLTRVLMQLNDTDFPLCITLLQNLDKTSFKAMIQGCLGNKILVKSLDLGDNDFVAKMIASSPQISWDFPDNVNLEEIYLKAINLNDEVMAELPYPLEITPAFALKAVSQNPEALAFIDPDIEGYKKISLQALERSPDVYKYISDELQRDPQIIIMKQCGVYSDLSNIDLVAQIIASSPKMRWDFPDSVNLEKIYLKAINLNDEVIAELPYPLEITPAFALKAVSQNPEALAFIDPEIEGYKEIALQALEKSPQVYRYIPDKLQRDPQIKVSAKRGHI